MYCIRGLFFFQAVWKIEIHYYLWTYEKKYSKYLVVELLTHQVVS